MTKSPKPGSTNNPEAHKSLYDPEYLRQQCRWIRDDLDPQIARDGPDALHSDDILKVDEFLRRLQASNISLEDIRLSRLHLAIDSISGLATRWPKRLIERADAVRMAWESKHGSLKNVKILLYEPGGRLHGICLPEDVKTEQLLVKWLKAPGVMLNPMSARRMGDLGFKPGDWWISPLFAFRDGIIDSAEPDGKIVADSDGAYAVLMTDNDEVSGSSPDAFTYRAKAGDRGRYRLTAATRESRQPLRILRGHSLRSFWAPKAGVRYDGLHAVVGWSIKMDAKTKDMVYEINFKRLRSELSMDIVLRRPFADEVEDYKEYKRLRHAVRAAREATCRLARHITTPVLTLSSSQTALDTPVTWVENLAVRPNGWILPITTTSPKLNQLDPATTTLRLLHDFSAYGNAIQGITTITPDVFAIDVLTCNITALLCDQGSVTTWLVDLNDGPHKYGHGSITLRQIAAFPKAGFLNGMAALNSNVVLLADSYLGGIWSLEIKTGRKSLLFTDPCMNGTSDVATGVNGIRVRPGVLYFTDSAKGTFNSIPIDPSTGAKVGEATVIASGLAGPDDFEIYDATGVAYVCSGPLDQILKIALNGGNTDVVAHVPGPTSVRWGTDGLGNVFYVSDIGGLGQYISHNFTTGGAIYSVKI